MIKRWIALSFAISAILCIMFAIASPNGVLYYEPILYIKIFEISISIFAIYELIKLYRV